MSTVYLDILTRNVSGVYIDEVKMYHNTRDQRGLLGARQCLMAE